MTNPITSPNAPRPSIATSRCRQALVLVALAGLCSAVVPAHAQARKAADPSAVTLTDKPFKIESLGVSVFLPEGSEASSYSMQGDAAATIKPQGADTWVISVGSRMTSNKNLSVEEVVEGVVDQLLGSAKIVDASIKDRKVKGDVGTLARLIELQPAKGEAGLFVTSGEQAIPIARCYVEMPPVRGNTPMVRGFTVAKIGPTQFVTFELFTAKPDFAKAKPLYETMIASATFADVATASAERGGLVSAGLRIMRDFTQEDLMQLAQSQEERWERIYRPSKSGKVEDDTEVGYRRIRVALGTRRDVDSAVSGALATQQGVVVRIDARILEDDRIVDSQSTFFMAPDRADEVWTIAMSVKADKSKSTHTETGARSGDSMTVRVESPGRPVQSVRPQIAGEGYISRVEAFLMPQIIVRSGIASVFGFYSYQSQAQTIQFRRDSLERTTAAESKVPDAAWKLTTRLSEDQPEQISYFSKDAALIRTEMGSGAIAEPTSGDRLLQIWKSKGLPT